MKVFRLWLISLVLTMALPLSRAQENTQLVLSIPEWMGDAFNEEVFDEFEAAHPGVEVVIVKAGDSSYITPPAYSMDDFLKNIEANTTSADVFLISELSPVGTRAGYILNLEPLVRADTTLDINDFYPAAWQAYQWDGGIWAIPVSFDVNFMVYNPAKFDAAGLSYPTPSWTLEDYANAAEVLATRDASGKVTMPGLINWNPQELMRVFSGRGFYDDNFPADPLFTSPELIQAATRWQELTEAGVVGYPANGTSSETDFSMMIGGGYLLEDWQGVTDNQGVMLPGNTAFAYTQGFAASAGTQNPELAYELIKYLTGNQMLALRTGGAAARMSIDNAEQPEDAPIYRQEYSPETEAMIDEAQMNALSFAEFRYGDYVSQALNPQYNEDGTPKPSVDLTVALQEAEAKARADIQAATDRRNATTLVVVPPAPLPELAPGEVGIKFGMFVNISPMPNRERWDAFAEEFAANDPEVGYVVVEPSFGGMEHPAEIYDCFYSENWYTQSDPQANLLNLDPFMAADPSFDRADFLPGALEGLQDAEGQTWAFPILLSPRVLAYNTEIFDAAGIPYPQSGWTVSEFIGALQQLQAGGFKPFENQDWGSSYINMLIAAFGGQPADLSGEELALNFTEPANVEAIRQVLDLAKQDFLPYTALATNSFGGGGGGGGGGLEGPAIVSRFVSDLDWGFGEPTDENTYQDPYRNVTYPRGSTFVPVSYILKGGYISNQAASPEACYRFLSAVSQQTDLFSGMPARYSAIDRIADARGEVFRTYGEQLRDPNVVIINDQWTSTQGYVANFLIMRAFDRYVLENADLVVELENAQKTAQDVATCMDALNLEELNGETSTPEELEAAFNQQRACALNADPDLETLFPSME